MPIFRLFTKDPWRQGRSRAIAALLVGLVASPAGAAVFTVGAPGTGCSHETIPDAVVAAEANPGADTIRITRSRTYPAQQLQITTAQDLSLVGGFATCAQTVSDDQKTELNGMGAAQAPVLLLRTSASARVRLRLLRLSAGDSTVAGGGINYVGNGELELIEMEIVGNSAPNGGGIYFAGNAAGARLTISNDNLISGNQATAGGGIYLVRAGMTMDAPGSSLAFNVAQVGGGLYVYGSTGGTFARIGSNGYSGLAAVYGNEAAIGGGVAVHAPNVGEDTDASFELFSADPAQPARISNNFASQRGGAIDLQNYQTVNFVGEVDGQVFGGHLEDNIAPLAPAVYIGHNDDAFGLPRGSQFVMSGGRIAGNIAADADSVPTGSAILVATESTDLTLARVSIENNTARHIVRGGAAREVAIRDSLIAGNTLQDSVFSVVDDGLFGFTLDSVTIAGNTIGAGPVIFSRGETSLGNSIIWQPGRTTLDAPGAAVDDVLASEIASLGTSPTIVSAPPRFIDPARGNYRLQAASRAVDFSGVDDGFDLDAVGRGVDLERVANFIGAGDLGAFERAELGNLALNAEFVVDLNLWQSGLPGSTATWQSNGSGVAGSAALSMSAAPGGNFVGLSQCVRIPGPGFYRLTGLAYGSGGDPFTRDIPSLRWRLRNDSGGEDCAGAVDQEGVVTFGNDATWNDPVAPGLIDVGAAVWTRYTNVEVLLQVREGSLNLNATTTGTFDRIRFEAVAAPASGDIFRDGFEP